MSSKKEPSKHNRPREVSADGAKKRKPGDRARKKPRLRIMRWLVLIPLFIIAAIICGASVVFVVFAECSKDLPNVDKLKYYSPSETTSIYSSDGVLLYTLFKENREWASYQDISHNMINAIVSIEDSRFYEHRGIKIGRAHV